MNIDFIRSIDLFRNVDNEICAMLARACSPLSIGGGELIIEAGSKGSDLYLIASGCLEVFLKSNAGSDRVIRYMNPGQSVGELSMLTGAYRSASVKAAEPSNLYRITRSQFNEIAELQPDFKKAVETVIQQKMHSANLSAALYKSQLFDQLNDETRSDLQNEIALVPLKKGDRLINQNSPSDSLYIVVSGKLRVFTGKIETKATVANNEFDDNKSHEPDNKPIVDVGLGQTLGEKGFLTGEPRSASVVALRDTLVGRLTSDAYFRLLKKHPQELTRLVSTQLLESTGTPERRKNRTFAIIGINSNATHSQVPVDALAERLCWHLEHPWTPGNQPPEESPTATYINPVSTDRLMGEDGISESSIESVAHLHLQNWFAEQEQYNDYVFFGAQFSNNSIDAGDKDTQQKKVSNWLRRIASQVDCIVFVTHADTDINSIEIPDLIDTSESNLPLEPGCCLVLLHPENAQVPSQTNQWLEKFKVESHHHIRWSENKESVWQDRVCSDEARVSRLLSGNGIGLVLSGGAARGFAHMGIVRALHEARVPIDLFGGASAGAISAAIIASGYNDDQARNLVMMHGKSKNMNDFTLPLTSLFKGQRFSALMRTFVGDVCIEDLWTPLYCVSINLVNATEVVHRRGPLWKYVRASASMPILLPPVTDETRLLVDGAMLNAMPVEVMRDDPGCGTVIGVDVSGGTGMRGEYVYGTELSGWRQILRRLNPFAKPYRSPQLSTTILAISAIGAVGRLPSQRNNSDVYIRPPVHKFQMMDYDNRDKIMDAGYEAGKKEIAAWLSSKLK